MGMWRFFDGLPSSMTPGIRLKLAKGSALDIPCALP